MLESKVRYGMHKSVGVVVIREEEKNKIGVGCFEGEREKRDDQDKRDDNKESVEEEGEKE